MGRPNRCCNPLNKKDHKCISSGFLVTEKWDEKFKNCVGLFVCSSCRVACYREKNVFFPKNAPSSSSKQKSEEEEEDENNKDITDSHKSEEEEEEEDVNNKDIADSHKSDPTYQCEEVDDSLKMEKVNALLHELRKPPLKRKRLSDLSLEDRDKILSAIDKSSDTNFQKGQNSETSFIKNITDALHAATTRSDKLEILTTVPSEWTIAKMCRIFKVSRRIASSAKKLHESCGYASRPAKNTCKRIPDATIENVQKFYLSDFASRIMPGVKDCISIVKDGKKVKAQKRLLLFNLDNLYHQFKEEFPESQIGISKFRKLRPRECITVGHSGTHNVCVCKMHQNMELKIYGIKQQLKIRAIDFTETSEDFIKNSVCPASSSDCFLLNCKECPRFQSVITKWKLIFTENNILDVTLSQWTSTDRFEFFLFDFLLLFILIFQYFQFLI